MKGQLLVYALVLLGTVGALYRPKLGLYVYLAFSILRPPYLWSWAAGLESVSLYVGVGMLLGWAIHGFGKWDLGRGKAPVALLTVFVIWNGLSALQAVDPSKGWLVFRELLKIVLPVLVGVTTLRGEAAARVLTWIMVATQGYVSFEINRSYFQGYNLVREVGFGSMDNNAFGVSLVTTVGLAFGLALSTKQTLWKGIAALCGLLIVHATLLTFSRGAMLGLGVVVLSAAVLIPKRPRYVAAMILVGAVVLRLTGPELRARFETAFASEGDLDYSAGSRIQLWSDCFTAALRSPFFGVGPHSWTSIAADYGWPPGKEAHSTWMETMAELGFPGFAALAFFYLVTIVRLLPYLTKTAIRAGPERALLAVGFITALIGFGVAGQFVTMNGLETPFYIVMTAVVLMNGPAVSPVSAPQPMQRAAAFQPRSTLVQGRSG